MLEDMAAGLKLKTALSPPRDAQGAGVGIIAKADSLDPLSPKLWD